MTTAPDRTETSQDFVSTKAFRAPPESVLAALRTVEGITDWWGPTTGSAEVEGTFEVSFAEGKVVWTVEETPRTPEWVGTTIVFDVTASGDGTALHFRHHGLTPQLECFDMCHAGWTHYLSSLVSYADTGQGQPSRNKAA
jgi:uncharacterized protein YndB with AHSA1/START domain